jgi:hypothetical protein
MGKAVPREIQGTAADFEFQNARVTTCTIVESNVSGRVMWKKGAPRRIPHAREAFSSCLNREKLYGSPGVGILTRREPV